jgi:hypothetical protein
MSILAATAAGLGAVTGLVGNIQTNNTNIRLQREQQQFNAQQAKQANEWNMQQWQRENEYNAPAQQMARLEAAGLNPNLMYGQGNPGSASKLTAEVPQGVAPAKVSNSLAYLSNAVIPIISMYQDLQNKSAQHTVQLKQAQLMDEEIAGKALDNISKGYINTVNESRARWALPASDFDYYMKDTQLQALEQKLKTQQYNNAILKATSPALIEKANWITRDVKQRALGGEINNELNRSLKPFGVTQNDELWQRMLIPTITKLLQKFNP